MIEAAFFVVGCVLFVLFGLLAFAGIIVWLGEMTVALFDVGEE